MHQDAGFMEFTAVVFHHPVIGSFYKGNIHRTADSAAKDLCGVGIFKSTEIEQAPVITVVKVGDVRENDLTGCHPELLPHKVLRGFCLMVMGRAVLVGIFLWAVRHQIHLIHDPAAFLHGDGDPVITPQKSPEGTLARHVAELLHDLPEHFFELFFFQFFGCSHRIQFFPALLPCVIAGTGYAEHPAALLLGIRQSPAFLPADEGIQHQEYIVFHRPGFDDVSMSANTEDVFF